MTEKLGVIGYPLKHSLSPAIQQAALDSYGLNIRYELWETLPHQLVDRINFMRSSDVKGANITIPYKESILQYLDWVDDKAKKIGAVNTIAQWEHRLIGYNTDADGFLRAIREQGSFDPSGKSVLIIGAGGAAKAVAFALISSGARSIAVTNHHKARAEKLVAWLKELTRGSVINSKMLLFEWAQLTNINELRFFEMIVNCTPLGTKNSEWEGMTPLKWHDIFAGCFICDLVYNPMETELMKQAKKAGAKTLGGLPMLVHQGALAFELWTGKKAPVYLMFNTALKLLG